MSDATTAGPLTVVLVHGAFADSSSWTGVIERLQAHGVPVFAAVNPLRGISIDSAYVASVFDQVPGRVLAVGHSYGGAVISNAASRASNVVGLVYVAAFAPDEGETLHTSTRPGAAQRRSSRSTRRRPGTPSPGTCPRRRRR
jgi:pimeloyl-ACP methyl ester carboxylesterase